METIAGKGAVAVLLSLSFAAQLGAVTSEFPSFEECRAQKQCRLLSHAELDRLRGGFSVMSATGPLDITFGISQAVYINGQLVAFTQLVLPGTGQAIGTFTPSSAQMEALNAALKGASVIPLSSSAATGTGVPAAAGSSALQSIRSAAAAATQPAASAPQTPASPATGLAAKLNAPSKAGAPVPAAAVSVASAGSSPTASAALPASTTTGLNATLNTPTSTSSPAQPPAVSAQSASSSPTASAGPTTVFVNSAPVIPGRPVINVPTAANTRTLIIQNGPGNVTVPSAADIRAATNAMVIQNTLNDQSIRAVTQMNVSLGLSQAMSAASIRDSVRQGMVNSRP